MNLPIFRQLTYISPTMFLKWRACQFKVYLSRLAGHTYPEQERSYAASVGTAFDAFVKDYIAIKRKIVSPVLSLDFLLKGLSKESIIHGKQIAKVYINSGWIQLFLDIKELRLEQEVYGNYANVPILGRIDAILDGVPFDWKVRGANSGIAGNSANKIYPTKGFGERTEFDLISGGSKKIIYLAGQKVPQEIPLEQRNEDWAIQLLFYNWLVRDIPYKFQIHEIVQQDNNLIFVNHEYIIGLEFARQIKQELDIMWNKINYQLYYADIEEPRPRTQICENYGQLCEVAQFCNAYMNTLGNPVRRINYV